jgi:hypothetical protein
MVSVSIEGNISEQHDDFINECIMALFRDEPVKEYDISIHIKKYVDKDGSHAGFCMGDEIESSIDIATHWMYEDGEEVKYTPLELAGHLAHELVHAKQFARQQINMVDHVWKHNGMTVNCKGLKYAETPWEEEAYAYETILTDLLWEIE